MEELKTKFSVDYSSVDRAMNAMTTAGVRVSQALEGAGGQVGLLTQAFHILNSPAGKAAALFTALGLAVQSATSAMVANYNAVKQLVNVTGLAVEEADNLANAFQLLGKDSYQITSAMFRMVGEIESGGRGLNRLGISIRNSRGELKNEGETFLEVRKRLSELTTASERNSISFDIFGRQARGLTDVFSKSEEEFQKFLRTAERFSPWSEKSQETAKAFVEAQGKVGLALSGVAQMIGVAVAPAITKMNEAFAEWIVQARDSRWWAVIIETFNQLTEAIGGVTKSLPDLTRLWQGMGDAVRYAFITVNVFFRALSVGIQTILVPLRGFFEIWKAILEGDAVNAWARSVKVMEDQTVTASVAADKLWETMKGIVNTGDLAAISTAKQADAIKKVEKGTTDLNRAELQRKIQGIEQGLQAFQFAMSIQEAEVKALVDLEVNGELTVLAQRKLALETRMALTTAAFAEEIKLTEQLHDPQALAATQLKYQGLFAEIVKGTIEVTASTEKELRAQAKAYADSFSGFIQFYDAEQKHIVDTQRATDQELLTLHGREVDAFIEGENEKARVAIEKIYELLGETEQAGELAFQQLNLRNLRIEKGMAASHENELQAEIKKQTDKLKIQTIAANKELLIAAGVTNEILAQQERVVAALETQADATDRLQDLEVRRLKSVGKLTGDLGTYMRGTFLNVYRQLGNALDGLDKLVSDAFASMSRTMSDVFFDTFTGKAIQAAEVFRSFLNSMLRSLSDFLAQQAVRQFLAILLSADVALGGGGGAGTALGGTQAVGTVLAGGEGGAGITGGGALGAALALLPIIGAGVTGFGGVSGDNPQLTRWGGLATAAGGTYQLANAAGLVGGGMNAGLLSAQGLSGGLGLVGGVLSYIGAQNKNRQLVAAGQLVSTASLGVTAGVGLAAAATAGGIAAGGAAAGAAAGGGLLGASAAAAPYIAAAVLAALSIKNAFDVSGKSWTNLSASQQAGTQYGAMYSPAGVVSGAPLWGQLVPAKYSAFIDPIGAYVGGLIGSLFGSSKPVLSHTQREALETSQGLSTAGGYAASLGQSKSLPQLYERLVSLGSGYTGGTSPVAIGTSVGGRAIGRTNPTYPTIGYEEFKQLSGQGLPGLQAGVQLGVSPSLLTGFNEQFRSGVVQMAQALYQLDVAFEGEITRLQTVIVPLLTHAEQAIFAETLTQARQAYATAGVEEAQKVLKTFEEQNQETMQRVQRSVQAMTDTLTQALQSALQAPSVESGVAVFAQAVQDGVRNAVVSGLVNGLAASPLLQGIIAPAIGGITDVVQTIVGAGTGATPEFLATQRGRVQTLLGGVSERLGPVLPVLGDVFTFIQSLKELPFGASGGWIPLPQRSPGGDTVPWMGMPGEFVVNPSAASRYGAELEQLNATGAWPQGGTTVIVLEVSGRKLAEVVIDDLKRTGLAGRQVLSTDLLYERTRG